MAICKNQKRKTKAPLSRDEQKHTNKRLGRTYAQMNMNIRVIKQRRTRVTQSNDQLIEECEKANSECNDLTLDSAP